MAALGKEYIASYLAEAVFQKFVAVFEDWIFGVIGAWLAAYPGSLAGHDADDRAGRVDKTVPIEVILENPDRESILRAIIDRELDRIKYRRLAAWFAYLERKSRLGVPAAEEVAALAEIKAARDVLTHNAGVVNRTYLDKAGAAARYAEGERLEVSEPYLREAWGRVAGVVDAVSDAALAKA